MSGISSTFLYPQYNLATNKYLTCLVVLDMICLDLKTTAISDIFRGSYFNYYILFKKTKKINKILIFEFIFLQIKIPIYCVDVFLFDADVAKGDLG